MKQSINKFFTPESEAVNRYYIADFDPEKNPENNYVAILGKHIPENARVLDLGCAQGRFAPIFKKKNCYAVGVELDETAAEYAQKTGAYEKIYIGDMTDAKSDIYGRLSENEKFDIVIMTDILEHVAEPTKMLRMYDKVLQFGGAILISVPNFANIKVALDLLNNQIAYDDEGILDNTHLKWYTKISFIQWMRQLNDVYKDMRFDCQYVGTTIAMGDFGVSIQKQYPELYNILTCNDNLHSLQILFKLTKIDVNEQCVELEKLEENTYPDVVDILGRALQNKEVNEVNMALQKRLDKVKKNLEEYSDNWKQALEANNILQTRLDEAQKGWNECSDNWKQAVEANNLLKTRLDEAQKGWNECSDNWKQAVEVNNQLQTRLDEAQKGWEECAQSWKSAVDANYVKDQEIDALKEDFENREKVLKQKVDALYARIDEIEAKINPIMERDLELQRENNKYKEERKEL